MLVVADDSLLLRDGLQLLLGEAGHEVVAAVADGPSYVAAMLGHRPEVGVVAYDLDTIRWRLMLPVPEDTPAPAGRVALERFAEGRSAQVLHIGPYGQERPTIERLHGFIEAQGLRPRGLHHEIYLNNPEEVEPSELRTIIRQPVG